MKNMTPTYCSLFIIIFVAHTIHSQDESFLEPTQGAVIFQNPLEEKIVDKLSKNNQTTESPDDAEFIINESESTHTKTAQEIADDQKTVQKNKVILLKTKRCPNCLLAGVDLKGADLIKANMRGADLTGAQLQNANLLYADLTGAILTQANLSSAILTNAQLTANPSTKTTLTNAILIGSKLIQADLSQANLEGANLTRAELSSANLDQANLSKANLQEALLDNASLNGTDLSGSNRKGIHLTKSQLLKAIIPPDEEIKHTTKKTYLR